MNNNNLSIADINKLLVNYGVEDVVSHLVGHGNYQRNNNTLGMASYQGGKSGQSFQVTTNGANAGIWHENNPSDSPNPAGQGDLVELWSLVKGLTKGEALKEIRAFLGEAPVSPKPRLSVVNNAASIKSKLPALSESQKASKTTTDKYEGRLRQNDTAKEWLYRRGLTDETIGHFRIGLSTPYNDRRNNVTRSDALVFPTINKSGFVKPYGYYNIPDVTQHAIDGNGWCAGSPRMSFNVQPTNQHQFLFIAEGFKDLWMLHQIIAGTEYEKTVLIMTSTHGSRVPEEAQDNPAFFNDFEKVFLGFDADEPGEKITQDWLIHVGPRAYRVAPYFDEGQQGKDWTDFFRSGQRTAQHFAACLRDAIRLTVKDRVIKAQNLNDFGAHHIASLPDLDVTSAFHNGQLYYSVVVLESGLTSDGEIGLNETVKVIRSDRQVLDVFPVKKSVRYSLSDRMLYRLSDGTLLKKAPEVSAAASWTWEQAYSWISGDFKARRLATIVDNMVETIKRRVWLPNEDDYTILALTMATTYVQQIFDAVPFLLATGPAGSGKTELGRILKELGCNAVVTGDISSKTITRLIDQTKGFLIIDDAEKLMNRGAKGSNGTSDVDDLLQILKVSYKKSSAIRQVTEQNNKGMSVRNLDFYGVKFFTNTKGMEDILATRTIQIHTRKPTNGYTQVELPLDELRAIRSELHVWAMENAAYVEDVYRSFSVSNRDDEITTPLRVFAQMERRQDWGELVDRLITRMANERNADKSDSPEGYLKEALYNIARRGYISVTMEHVLMEMEMLVPSHFGKAFTTDIPEWKHAGWAKNQLFGMGYLTDKAGKRVRVAGRDVPMQRLYVLSGSFYNEFKQLMPQAYADVMDKQQQLIDGNDYCRNQATCATCPYANIECDIRNKTNKR